RQMLGHSLVHTFVPAADEQQFRGRPQTVGHRLVEKAALGREQHHFPRLGAFRPDRFHRAEHRLGLEHHAFAAAARPIVHRLMAVAGPIAQIVKADVEQPGVFGALHHAEVEGAGKEFRENGEDVEDHGRLRLSRPSGNSTAMRWDAGSISTQMERANGMSRSPTTSRPEPPPSSRAETRPRERPVRRSTTSQPTRSDTKNSPSSSGTRAATGIRTSAPVNSSAAEMESTPRNLKMRVASWNQVDSTSYLSPVPDPGVPDPNR